jgi:hypothetical protein
MVNTNYLLAGGMDTPSLTAERRYDDMDFAQDGRFKRGWMLSDEAISTIPTSTLLGGERNGQGRVPEKTSTPNKDSTTSWGSLVLGVVGGVVGGVWAFCKNSAFPGFYAGGGQGYEIRRNEQDIANESMWEDEPASLRFERVSTPVPGGYPDSSDEERPAKRIQTDSGGGGWIMVSKTQQDDRRRASSPRMRTPSTQTRQPSSHHRQSGTSRRSLGAAARPKARISSVSYSGSPAQYQPQSRPSLTEPQTPAAPFSASKKPSPLSEEVRRLATRKRKEEKVTAERYDRLNDRLQEMIREGRQALGARVEVVEEDEQMNFW